jgi:hypothetical protein
MRTESPSRWFTMRPFNQNARSSVFKYVETNSVTSTECRFVVSKFPDALSGSALNRSVPIHWHVSFAMLNV